jgi:hypothetical protein
MCYNINIIFLYDWFTGLLNVDISSTTDNVIQGTSQQIVCSVTGTLPATAIIWTRSSNNQLITLDIANSNGKYLDGSVSQPSITISNFQSSNAGTYVCKATNLVGETSSQNTVLTYIGRYSNVYLVIHYLLTVTAWRGVLYTTLCDTSLSMTCGKSVVFTRYSGFFHQ